MNATPYISAISPVWPPPDLSARVVAMATTDADKSEVVPPFRSALAVPAYVCLGVPGRLVGNRLASSTLPRSSTCPRRPSTPGSSR